MDSDVLVLARRELAAEAPPRHVPAVLLEGSWPDETGDADHRALDLALGPEFAWLDALAVEMLESLEAAAAPPASSSLAGQVSPVFLNALALRYYLLKLLRVVVYFSQVQPPTCESRLRLVAARGRDADYADLLGQLCRLRRAELEIHWRAAAPRSTPAPAPNGIMRRTLAALAGWLGGRPPSHVQLKAVFCGNPRLLGPVAWALRRQRAGVWWLNDRFALRGSGGGLLRRLPQLVCHGSLGTSNGLSLGLPQQLEFEGVDLAPVVGSWLAAKLIAEGPCLSRQLEAIDAHFRRVGPDVLVLDEDATPLHRAAIAVARHHGVPSVVLQHGAPCARFGFAPLAADRILVWGESSRQQLLRWGVPPQRVIVTGSPHHEVLRAKLAARRRPARGTPPARPHLLLLGTTPPRAERPDLVALQFHAASYEGMLRDVLAAVAARGGARLTVKPHPRAAANPILARELARVPGLEVRMVRGRRLEDCLDDVDCVLSLMSSAGVDAVLSGVPVIQVLPSGAVDLLAEGDWGQLGNAHSVSELSALLEQALSEPRRPAGTAPSHVFDDGRPGAVQRIVGEVARMARRGCGEPSAELTIPAAPIR